MTDARLSKFLPPSLGTMFGQPVDREPVRQPTSIPSTIPGAFAASELCLLVDQFQAVALPRDPVAEVKLDGIRCLSIGGRLVTREASPFEAAAHCLPVLDRMTREFGQPMFFDGEYVEDGGFEATLAAFRSRRGAGCLWLFDAVPLAEWETGQPSRRTLVERKAALRRVMLAVASQAPDCPVGYIEHRHCSAGEIEGFARDLWSTGYEGLVVKAASSRYVRKRTSDWMKVKMRSVSDMVVVDMLGCKRDGRDTAKSLLVRLPGAPPSPAVTRIPLRGGLADTLWDRRALVVGSLVQVEHAGFTGGGHPREATLKQVTLPFTDEEGE